MVNQLVRASDFDEVTFTPGSVLTPMIMFIDLAPYNRVYGVSVVDPTTCRAMVDTHFDE
jgi:hypothetical protein